MTKQAKTASNDALNSTPIALENRSLFQFHRVIEMVMNQPLMVSRETLDIYLHVLGEKVNIDLVPEQAGGEVGVQPERKRIRPYRVVDGNGIIPIQGTTVRRVAGVRPYSGMVGYNQIERLFNEALADDEVHTIVLDIDSPGGEAFSCFDIADMIYNARGTKPIIALANPSMHSAAYAIGSAADKVFIPQAGSVGSIGVIGTHFDVSKAMEQKGVKPTLIYAGKHKADLTSFAPLEKEAMERLQASVNSTYEMFVNLVARNRGMTVEAVRATEALTYRGTDAIDIGFADGIVSAVGFAESASSHLKSLSVTAKEHDMHWIEALMKDSLGIELKDSDEANEQAMKGYLRHLESKAKAQDAITAFCTLHGVESLDEMTAKMQTLVPAAEVEALQTKMLALEAEEAVTAAIADGKVLASNKDWALDFYTRDKEGFQKVVVNGPKLAPGPAAQVPDTHTPSEQTPKTPQGLTDDEYAALRKDFGEDLSDDEIDELLADLTVEEEAE